MKSKKPTKFTKLKEFRAKKKSEPIKTSSSQTARRVLAIYLLVILLLQLFAFEDFPAMLAFLTTSEAVQKSLAIIIVLAELIALPCLIGLKTRNWLQKLGLISTILALVLLTVLEVLAVIDGSTMLFGATFDLPSGTWSLFFLAAMWVLAVWANIELLAAKKKAK